MSLEIRVTLVNFQFIFPRCEFRSIILKTTILAFIKFSPKVESDISIDALATLILNIQRLFIMFDAEV